MPITQGSETSCKKFDETIVVMKRIKLCGEEGPKHKMRFPMGNMHRHLRP